MGDVCAQCGQSAAPSSLCPACARRLDECPSLLPEHIASATRAVDAAAWLTDPWGRAHGLRRGRTAIGRDTASDIALFHDSVSREHAVLVHGVRGWSIRDLGSKNGVRVDGERVDGRGPIRDGVAVQLGKVPLVFRLHVDVRTAVGSSPVTTASVVDMGARCVLRSRDGRVELALDAVTGGDGAAGIAEVRAPDGARRETSLAGVEFELLRMLVEQARRAGDGASQIHRCVATRELARRLPFRSPHANEENVRQAVRRVRAALEKLEVVELIEAHPPHGYCVAWAVD